MLISARESSRILAEGGFSRQQSRRLGRWTAVQHDILLDACAGGVLVVRLAPGAEPDPTWSWSRRVESVRSQPLLGFAAWLQVVAHLSMHGRLACAVTVCGYPVLLADLVSFHGAEHDRVELGLEQPGAWARLLDDRRLVTSSGPPWLVLGAQPYLGRARRAREQGEPVNAARSTTWTRWA